MARARGDPRRRPDQLAAAAEALGHRPGRRSCAALGIPVVHDLPGVGENLQDHLEFYFQVASQAADHALFRRMSLSAKALIGAALARCARTGSAPPTISRAAASSARAPGVRYPDIQYHFLPLAVTYDGTSLASEHGFQAHVGPMRSQEPRLRPAALGRPARARRRIRFNYMSHADDWAEMRACVRLTREIFAPAGLRPLSRPGDPAGRRRRDATRRSTPSSARRSRAPTTPPAPAGWADPDDPMAVVDPRGAGDRRRGAARGRHLDHAARSPPATSTRRRS